MARDPETQDKFAVKSFSGAVAESDFLREVEALSRLNHPCILGIRGWTPPENSKKAQIHTEFAENRSQKDVLERVKCGDIPSFWNPTGIGILICGVVLGMRYVHSQGIIHRNLTPSNILVNGKGHVWINGFSCCHFANDNDWTPPEVGPVHYSAPEMWDEDSIPVSTGDVFAFGSILYELLVGQPVFRPSELRLSVLRGLRSYVWPSIPTPCGTLMQELIPQCWKRNPDDRPSFEDITCLFESRGFALVPGCNPLKIREFCESVLKWESLMRVP
jgi:serine/threonine protein kinase